MKARLMRLAGWLLICFCSFPLGARAAFLPVGVARIDVTPAEPIRLTGYAVRRTNSVGVEQKLWAQALAIGSDAEGPSVLITLDNWKPMLTVAW